MGEQLYVADESVIDKVTAVSGSGPAYVFLIIEAMINAAVNIGLRPDDARRMVLQTLSGSTKFAEESGEHPAVLKDMVTSPGGTTAAGLRVLEQRGVRAALIDAVAAAQSTSGRVGSSMSEVLFIIGTVIQIYSFILLGRVLMSWIPMFTNRPLDPNNPLVKIMLGRDRAGAGAPAPLPGHRHDRPLAVGRVDRPADSRQRHPAQRLSAAGENPERNGPQNIRLTLTRTCG